VKFDERNLVRADSPLWQPDIYDIVFFRNVLMYFTPENGQRVIARIGRALKPGGYQFLGHAETLRGLSTDFHLRHTHETFYYQRKAVLERGALHSSPITPSGERAPTVMAAVDGADTWIDAIRGATERIEILTSLPQSPASPRQGSPRAVPGPTWDLELARVLLREERFAESTRDGAASSSGVRARPRRFVAARRAAHTSGTTGRRRRRVQAFARCHRVERRRALSPGIVPGRRARPHGRRQSRPAAIYLDPSFAMPHLHLGLLARRAGDLAAAQKELAQALLLLQREDGSRVLLFGGGFTRETLVALCCTELKGCGGKP
jgi:chemotaxis protein methyltransferase CheR